MANWDSQDRFVRLTHCGMTVVPLLLLFTRCPSHISSCLLCFSLPVYLWNKSFLSLTREFSFCFSFPSPIVLEVHHIRDPWTG